MAKEITSPIKAIRAKCLDCCCDQFVEVKLCVSTNCPLHPFRFGKNPFTKRTVSEATLQALKEGREKMKGTNTQD